MCHTYVGVTRSRLSLKVSAVPAQAAGILLKIIVRDTPLYGTHHDRQHGAVTCSCCTTARGVLPGQTTNSSEPGLQQPDTRSVNGMTKRTSPTMQCTPDAAAG
jgi:hypothetical protein